MHISRYKFALISALTLLATAFSTATTAAAQVTTASYTMRGHRLSGTYQIDTTLSDNPRVVVDEAAQSLPAGRRDRIVQNWLKRLEMPQTIAIDVQGRAVTVASSNAPQFTFQADGLNHVERNENNRPVTTNAALRNNTLVVSTSGNRGADFTVTFQPVAGGLRVTRRLDSEVHDASVVSEAFYRRVSDARWDIYAGQPSSSTPVTTNVPDRSTVVVPAGTRFVARLNEAINADTVVAGQRVTFNVQGTGLYSNALIEGVVTREGTNIGIDFQNIQLNSGRTGSFDAVIDSIRTPDGKSVQVNNSAVADQRRRSTSRTVERGAIGAGIGAIIGAIIGGKEGAAIGAVAGGAGLILIDRNTDQKLPVGTEFTITAIRP